MARLSMLVSCILLSACCMTPRASASKAQLRVPPEMPAPKAVAERPRAVASAELERGGDLQEPVLERHVLEPAELADVKLLSRTFGGGTAGMRIHFLRDPVSVKLSLAVWRKVRSGTIAFALLVDRVEIRGRDAEGRLQYARTLPGFTFGDSASGFWKERLSDLPRGIATLSVAFFGNYE